MSDSCDFTAPIKHENEMDRGLSVYRDSHRAVARYTLILKENFREKSPFQVIKDSMDYLSANSECERLNAARNETGFGSPVYAIKIENSEEARNAVRIAANNYWKTKQ